jgi:hypothetical protein
MKSLVEAWALKKFSNSVAPLMLITVWAWAVLASVPARPRAARARMLRFVLCMIRSSMGLG